MTVSPKANIFLKYPGWTAGLLTMLTLLVWRWWTGFNGLYGQDSYAYLEYGKGLQEWMSGGDLPGAFFWPGGYPMLGALFGNLVGDLTLAFQLISILSITLSAGLIASMGSKTLPAGVTILITVGCIAFSPYLLRSGLACMSDSLAVAVVTLSLYSGQQYRNSSKGIWLALMVFLVAFGTWIRYPAGLLLAGILAIHLPAALKNLKFIPLLFGVLLGGIPLLLHLKLQSAAVPDHHFLDVWSPVNWFKRSFEMQDGAFSYRFPNLVYAFGPFYHPGYLGLATLALPFTILGLGRLGRLGRLRKPGMSTKRSSIPIAYGVLSGLFILFIAGIPFQNTRFLVILIPLCALNFFIAGGLIARWLRRKSWALGTSLFIILLLNIGISYFANAGFWKSAGGEKQIALAVGEYNSEKREQNLGNGEDNGTGNSDGVHGEAKRGSYNQVFTFGMDGALKHYLPEAIVTNLWNEDLSTLEWASQYQPNPGNLVLFNEARFSRQWAGKSPVLNWEYLNQTYQLDSLATFEGGWTLHEIH